ncbi:hypothetical protein FRC20_004716 [Serendipita sp. 405]|nr:hypothetical protein FRC20_004716 [Serendipita sp. 405]
MSGQYQDITFRHKLNDIVNRHHLPVTYSESSQGPGNAQQWIGSFTLENYGSIGWGTGTSKANAKEAAAAIAVHWLNSNRYY